MIRKVCFFGPKKMRFMQTESVLQTKNWSGPAKNRFSVALVLSSLMSAQRRLIRLCGCTGWSESSLGIHHFVGFVVLQLFFSVCSILQCTVTHNYKILMKWLAKKCRKNCIVKYIFIDNAVFIVFLPRKIYRCSLYFPYFRFIRLLGDHNRFLWWT